MSSNNVFLGHRAGTVTGNNNVAIGTQAVPYFQVKMMYSEIDLEFDNLASKIFTNKNIDTNHGLHKFCKAIGITFESCDKVKEHIRNNKNLHDFWLL